MRSILLVFFCFSLSYVHAQSLKADTSYLGEAKKNAIAIYNNLFAEESPLLNGSLYVEYKSPYANETPYFINEWVKGDILYNGGWYSVPFRYDIIIDKLIITTFNEYKQLQLVSAKISRFSLSGHNFVQLRERGIPEGFYEITYDGQTKVYVRWQKMIKQVVEFNKTVEKIELNTAIYIKKNDAYYPVKNKRSVLKVFSEFKSELNDLFRSNDKRYKGNEILLISEMARAYDQLKATK